MTWQPINEARLLEDIEVAELAMRPQSLAIWKLVCIRPVKWHLSPWGDMGGGFWVVAVVGRECVWFNDIEGGYNTSPFSDFGVIGEYRCGQLGLHDLMEWHVEKFQRALETQS